MHVLWQVGFVALGSALGGLLRWVVGVTFARWLGPGFPWGTLFINLTGCAFLGWLSVARTRLANDVAGIGPDSLWLLLAVGFTGAYTTFSTFEYESNSLLGDGDGLKAMTYIFGSVFLGLIAVRVGIHLAHAK